MLKPQLIYSMMTLHPMRAISYAITALCRKMAENMELGDWRLRVDGEVNTPLELTMDDLKNNFEVVKLKLQLECGGNGRAAFNPPAQR